MGDPGLPGPQGLRGGMGDRVSGHPSKVSRPCPRSHGTHGQRPRRVSTHRGAAGEAAALLLGFG